MSEAIEAPVAAPEPAATPAVESQTEGHTADASDEEGILAELAKPPQGLQYPKWERERIKEMARKNGEMERQLNLTRAELARYNAQQQQPNNPVPQDNAPQAKPITEADLERVIAEREEGVKFNERSNAVYAQGIADNPDFGSKIQEISQLGIPQAQYVEFLKDVIDLPNPSQVLYTLGSDLDQTAHILSLPPRKQALALATLSASLAAGTPAAPLAAATASPPANPPVVTSRAPAPTKAIVGRSSSSSGGNIYDRNLSMADYVKLREKGA